MLVLRIVLHVTLFHLHKILCVIDRFIILTQRFAKVQNLLNIMNIGDRTGTRTRLSLTPLFRDSSESNAQAAPNVKCGPTDRPGQGQGTVS